MCSPLLQFFADGRLSDTIPASTSGQMLPYAALWHLIFAAWAFSWFKLWPDPSSVVANGSFGDFVRAIGVQSGMHLCH